MTNTSYPSEYDAVLKTLQLYIDGSKQGKSAVMRPAFHPNATFFGYVGPDLAIGAGFLFDWIDWNGHSARIQPRFVSVANLDSIAVVRLKVAGWSGAMAGDGGAHMSDLFTLLRMPEGWKIIQKAFHWPA